MSIDADQHKPNSRFPITHETLLAVEGFDMVRFFDKLLRMGQQYFMRILVNAF